MSEPRQISSYMEKEKNMDKRPSSPTFSMDSLTPENNNIPISGFITHTSLDDDELMQCDDLLDKKELTCFNIHETMSLESRSLLSGSWSCSTDSVVSEVITSFDQDVNEVIKAVCQSFFENMETTESISTSSLTTGSDRSLSSPSTETAIAEAAKTLVSLVIDEAIKELDATEDAKTLVSLVTDDAIKELDTTEDAKTLISLVTDEAVKELDATEDAKTLISLVTDDAIKELDTTEDAKTLVSLVTDEAVKELDATKDSKTPKDICSLKTLQSTDCEKVLEDTDTLQRSQRKRCRDQRKVHPAPHSYLDEAVRSPSTDWTIFSTGESKRDSCGSQETTTFTSSSGDESADLRPIQRDLVDCTAGEDPTRVKKAKAKKSNRFLDVFRTETVIAEAAETLVSLVTDEAVKELDATEAAKTPKDIGSLKTLQSTDCEKVLEDTDTLQRSQRKRCRDQRKVHPAPHSYLDEAVRSPSTDWTIFCTAQSKQGSCGSQETTTITSSSGDKSADLRPIQRDLVDCTADKDPTRVEKTKAKKSNRFFDFFRNIFSKKNIKKKKKEVAVEENHSKLPSFWMHVKLL